jgi:HAD superfamily hydrolase (TIGR01458 family)
MKKLYLVDIEGAIVKDKSFTPIPGAVEWINSLNSSLQKFVLVSNNTTHKPEDLLSVLREKGFNLKEENLLTCLSTALKWLKKERIKSCFVLGSSQLRIYLNENDIKTPSDGQADAVLVGLDTELTYEKLKLALNALIKNDAVLLALHANRVYKDTDGNLAVSVGGIVKALEYSSQKVARIFGKPEPEIYQEAMRQFDARPEDCVMISDDPLSDLAGAKRLGMKAVFVTSGKYKDEIVLEALESKLRPDWIHPSVAEIRT